MAYLVLTGDELQERNPGNSGGSYSATLTACLSTMERKGWALKQVVPSADESAIDYFYFWREGEPSSELTW